MTNAGVYVCLLAAYRGLYVVGWVKSSYMSWYVHHPLIYCAVTAQAALYLLFIVDRVARYVRK